MHYSTSESPTSTVDHSHTCLRCGAIDRPTIGPGTDPHWRSARCRHCGAWLGWLSRFTPTERQARRQALAQLPPSEGQLPRLLDLKDPSPPPATTAEAWQRTDLLQQQKGGEV